MPAVCYALHPAKSPKKGALTVEIPGWFPRQKCGDCFVAKLGIGVGTGLGIVVVMASVGESPDDRFAHAPHE